MPHIASEELPWAGIWLPQLLGALVALPSELAAKLSAAGLFPRA